MRVSWQNEKSTLTTSQLVRGTSQYDTQAASPAYSAEPFVFDVGSLCAHFSRLVDKRKARGKRYSAVTLLTLMLLAKLGGENSIEGMADWCRQRQEALVELLGLKRASMPHATTFGRFLRQAIDPEQLEAELCAYFETQQTVREDEQRAIDGKQIRGTALETGAERETGNVYLLGIYAPRAGVMVMQVRLAAGQAELTCAPQALKMLDLQGKLVSGDAAFTQRALSRQIVAANGNFLWKVKDNQPKLLEAIRLLFAPPAPAQPGFSNPPTDFRTHTEHRSGHGRSERRTITVSSLLQGGSDWPHLAQVFKVECQRTCKKTGRTTHTISYGITSQSADKASPRKLLRQIRAHWGIEGGSHQRRDVTFGEDGCNLRRGHTAHMMAILNNIAIALIVRAGYTNAAHARRVFNVRPGEALKLMITAPD